MRYATVCSGIEAPTVAWQPLGWQPTWFSEIDKFPSLVLAHHYPDVPNMGDMTNFKQWGLKRGSVDLLAGGTPCQSFSVAGLRKGLDDPRGSLMLTYLAIVAATRPRWVVWENVPGVLSSNGGRDFGTFLGALGQLGYGFAYRVLDAQYFGVPQRRRRVFVVGYLGDSRRAAAVLFERHCLSGHPSKSRAKTQNIAAGTLRSTDGGSDVDHARAGHLLAFGGNDTRGPIDLAAALNANRGAHSPGDFESGTLLTVHKPIPIHDQATRHSGKRGDLSDGKGNGLGVGRPGDPSPTLTKGDRHAVAFHGAQDPDVSGDITHPLGRNQGQEVCIHIGMRVRRLTPLECERLQGFPDGYTDIMPNGKPTADGPRYKALGNSMAIPPVRWIGTRIQMVDAIV